MPEPQTQDNKPTEEHIKTANEVEMKKWEGDFDPESLKIPYKREENTEEQHDDVDTDEEEVEQQAEEYTDPEPVITTDDPGEYTPADYSFEVTLKDGKTVKVSTPEDADKIADDPDNFETPKQLMDFITKSNKMQRSLDRDYDRWKSQKDEFDKQQSVENERQQTVQSLVSGFEYLVSKGLLPKVDPKDAQADWSDPEVAKRPGVKEQIELINYMTKENAARQKAGVPILGSALDAYNAFQLDKNHKQATEQHRAEGEARKAAGARVSGVSASNQAPYVPKGIAVGRPNIFKRSQSVWED